MRLLGLCSLLAASLILSACIASPSSSQVASTWTTGFWFWPGSSPEATYTGSPPGVLFVHVGGISKERPSPFAPKSSAETSPWHAYANLPDELPPAQEYWAVFRFERQSLPDPDAAPVIANEVSKLLFDARKRKLNLTGVQLDIDCPTGALARYAGFLRELRKGLPAGTQVSITALLDWFRSGTAIAAVLKEVDEFVPQFYDLADRNEEGTGSAIAARIDAARWGPIFNRFGKRFRVGISTFGRARLVPRTPQPEAGYRRVAFFGDVIPLDLAMNPRFELHTSQNEAGELLLNYAAIQKSETGYTRFDKGDTVQFILATPESVRAGVESAKQMGGRVAGVAFFRWPGYDERLTMQPGEVLAAIAPQPPNVRPQLRIEVIDGHCAAVECIDLYLNGADPLALHATRYRIRSSAELEYFLPAEKVPIRMSGPSQLELSIPPYCGRGRLSLGRAVTRNRSDFRVEEQQ